MTARFPTREAATRMRRLVFNAQRIGASAKFPSRSTFAIRRQGG